MNSIPQNYNAMEKISQFAIYFLIVLFFVGCSTIKTPLESLPKEKDFSWVVASFYGKELAGNKTANGDIFDPEKFTAAHKSLPFGTRLRVVNPSNSKEVVVTVNDRGPFAAGRDIDLSLAAARKLGMVEKGVKRIKLFVLN